MIQPYKEFINLKIEIMEEKKNSDLKKSELCGIGYRKAIYPLILVIFLGFILNACEKDQSNDAASNDLTEIAGITNTYPANLAQSVNLDDAVSVTFKAGTSSTVVSSTKITLKMGSKSVSGIESTSGLKASFKSSGDLESDNEYEASVRIKSDDKDGKDIEYSWRFKTGKHHSKNTLSISSVTPADKATAVAVTSPVTVTFNKTLADSLKTQISITLAAGTTNVSGAITISGSTATFTPASPLTAGTLYTAKAAISSTGKSQTWSFTTAGTSGGNTDTTPPTVASVTPAINASSVAIASSLTATFSEAMTGSTITSSTFTLKQGSTTVAGTVTYSGTMATFKPSAALAQGTVYTATITTGAKDLAGNAIAASYSWNFTTEVPAQVGMSFSKDVMPVLTLCNNCHTHPWTTSTVSSTYYTNLVNGGYIDPNSPTSSKIYVKLSGGHPGSSISTADLNKVLNWITEGCKNN
jgi:hypothetical protein